MSRLAWQGPVFRLDLAYPSVALHRAPSRYAKEASEPVAVARLDAVDFDSQMRALAGVVRKLRARLDVVLPEAEVWRAAHEVGGPDDARRRQAQAVAAAAMEADPEALIVVLGEIDTQGRTPLAAIRRDTLAQARGFLMQFGLKADAITGAGRFPGFATAPRLDGVAARPVRTRPREAAGTQDLAKAKKLVAAGRQIWARRTKVLRGLKRGFIPLATHWNGFDVVRSALRTAGPLPRRVLVGGAAASVLILLTWALWPSGIPDEASPVAVVAPAPSLRSPAPVVAHARGDAEMRPTAVQAIDPSLPEVGATRETRLAPRPRPAPDPRPTVSAPAVVTDDGIAPREPAGSAARAHSAPIVKDTSAPQLAMPGATPEVLLPKIATFGTRSIMTEPDAAYHALEPETPAERVRAQIVVDAAPLPIDPPRVASLRDGPRARPGRGVVVTDASPEPTATEPANDAPGVDRPMHRPFQATAEPSQAALTQAIDGAVRMASVTAVPAIRMDRPARRSFAAPRQAVRDLPTATPVRAAAPAQVIRAAPMQIARAPNPVTRMVQRVTAPVRSAAASRQAASDLALIGIFGKSDARYALVRLPNAAIARVKRGDRIQGQQVAAVSSDGIVLSGSRGDVTLRLPD